MSNKQRHRKEFDRPRHFAVDSATVIEQGDLLYHDTNDVKPATDFTWDTNLATTAPQFAAMFAGVSADASAAANTDDVRVLTSGVFEFACASTTYEIGDMFGVDDNATPDGLLDQGLIKVTDPAAALFVAVERAASATTSVKVEMFEPSQARRRDLKEICINATAAGLQAAADVLTDYVFGRKVKIHSIAFVATTLTATECVISLHKGATAMDDTLTIATGTALGAVTKQLIADATGDDIIESDGTFSIVSDGAMTAGDGIFIVQFYEL